MEFYSELRDNAGPMKATLIIVLFIGCTSAFATDGNRLLELCSVAEKTDWQLADASQFNACANYITGVLDTQLMWQDLIKNDHGKTRHASVCIPDSPAITASQSALIVMKYLRNNPDKLHWTASALVVNAMQGAFPCT